MAKKDANLKNITRSKRIKNKNIVSKALWDCLVANDPEGFKEILRTHLELTNKDKLAKDTGIPKRTLYRMLSDEGNPTLENISKMIHMICT